MSPIAHSASRVAVYQRCPRRYYWQYVVKVPRRRTAAQAFGINVHAALEALGRTGGPEKASDDALRAALDATWSQEGFDSPAEASRHRREAEERLLLHLQARRAAQEAGEAVMIEQRLEGVLGPHPVVGVVDRVDRAPDGRLTLIDYKTGIEEAGGPTHGTLQQLAIYRSLVAQTLATHPDRIVVARPGDEDVEVTLDACDWDAILGVAQAAMGALERDRDFNPRLEASCEHCDFARRCVPWQRAQQAEVGP